MASYSSQEQGPAALAHIADNRYKTGKTYLEISLLDWMQETQKVRLKIQIRWDASWRDSENYDAAWIFCKVQDTNNQWHHANILPGGYKMLASATSKDLHPTFELPVDRKGLFVYRG